MALLEQSVTKFVSDDDLFAGTDNEEQPGAVKTIQHHSCSKSQRMAQIQTMLTASMANEEATVYVPQSRYFELYQDKCAEYEELLDTTQQIEQAYNKLLTEKNREIVQLRDATARLLQSEAKKADEIVKLNEIIEQLRHKRKEHQAGKQHPFALESLDSASPESRSG
eukprot:CAMPEP_0197028778 /NCGR_PEP_ID=MMETSP1384-20130603/8390_1 /TAXON_ID=29189 /ORGANISM="Ammonia sp." /LENGTH=166 /DNA_ID=CAMNT_0042457833 /DNA_START=34 /DNA_END=534 /DNA_ORIENTATION=+